MRIGILSLQGAVELHRAKLRTMGVEPIPVRTAEELAGCEGLILPGGESTTLLRLIGDYGLWEPLLDFAAQHPVWGICAGAILMAEQVENPTQQSLALIPFTVQRNGYGRQNESFIGEVSLSLPGHAPATQEGVFIRAPRFTAWGPQITVLAQREGQVVALQHGRHMVCAFHPELSPPDALHAHFLSICRAEAARATA